MNAFVIMFINVIIFTVLAIPGYLLTRFGVFKQEHSNTLSKLLIYVGLPFLVLSGTLSVQLNVEDCLNIIWTTIIGIVLTFAFFFASKFTTTKNKKIYDELADEKRKGMERFCEIFSNNGFLGVALVVAVFGGESKIFIYLIILNIITNALAYTIGVYLVSADRKLLVFKKILLNPVLIAFVIGIILNLIGFNKLVPQLLTCSDYFKNIVIPLSMTILGMKMATVDFKKVFSSWKMYFVSFIKLIVVPVVSVCIAILLNKICQLKEDVVVSIFFAFAMPTAVLALAFADEYNGAVEEATTFTLCSTIVLSFGLSVKTEDRKCGIKWFLISITSCLFSGSLGCFQKMLKFEYPNVKVENFVQVSFFFMLIISLFIVLLIWFIKRKKHVEKEDEFDHNTFSLKKIQWKYLVFIVATGVIMGLMNSINVFLAGALPSVVVFPSVNGGGIVATTILSIIIFKEKITKKQKLALLFGFCGILAIGFGGLFV